MYIHSYINIICFQLYITSSHPCGFFVTFFHVFFSLIKSVKSRLNTKNIVHYTFIIIFISFIFQCFSFPFLHHHFSLKKNEDQLFSSCIHRVLKRSSMKEVEAINQCLKNFLLHYFFTFRINKLRNWTTFLKNYLKMRTFWNLSK